MVMWIGGGGTFGEVMVAIVEYVIQVHSKSGGGSSVSVRLDR